MNTPCGAVLFHPPINEHLEVLAEGCSAISISTNWILAHGSALNMFRDAHALKNFIANMTMGELTIVPRKLINNLKFGIYHSDMIDAPREKDDSRIQRFGSLVAAWRCPLLKNCFDSFFNMWFFPGPSDYKLLRSVFLLIRVDSYPSPSVEEISTVKEALCHLLNQTKMDPIRGLHVEIVSTPFGNPMLMHSISHGVISNIVGYMNCVIMTDAVTFPNCEGGPVYVVLPNRRYKIVGMVITSTSHCRGEMVDFTFIANLGPCLSTILLKEVVHHPLSVKDAYHEDVDETLYKSVVEIRCGITFATGILVDKDTGTFLTCSHVVEEAPEREIYIVMNRNTFRSRISAKLVYKTLHKPFDVAVLRVDPKEINPSLQSIQLSDTPIVKGESVVCVGFQIYSSPWPSISSGVVSKLMDCMLLTTCCIQGGCSGGPVISVKTGKMLGMVVSSARSSDKTVFYSRFTMSVPATVLSEPLQQYLLTDNPDALETLTCNDPEVRKIWDLYPFLPSRL